MINRSFRRLAPALLAAAAPALAAPPPVAANPILHAVHQPAGRIPAFSRMYQTGCSTCHTAFPKLNVLGEAFRLNGYRMPESELLIRRDGPVPLGADPWKDLWPRSIWPGSVPGQVPLALRIQSDLRATRDDRSRYSWTYRMPNGVFLLAAASLGEDIGTFLEAGWDPQNGLQVSQARVLFQDPVPFVPPRALNVWLGRQNLYLFTFTDRRIDNAERQFLNWQTFSPSQLLLRDSTGREVRSPNSVRLGVTHPAVELNGILARRFYYGVGLAQGGSSGAEDLNNHKDLYYKLRYKIGGLDLTGSYGDQEAPVLGTGGQLQDRALILEHFGYFGDETTATNPDGDHRAFGAAVRALAGPLDLGVGYVWRRFDRPWQLDASGPVTSRSHFAKLEYLVFPWAMASLKTDHFRVRVPDALADTGVQVEGTEQLRVLPGAVFLIRQNVRAVAEGELFLRDQTTAARGLRRPHNLWLRVDLAF